MLKITSNKFNNNPVWCVPLDSKTPIPYKTPDLFDQNGYDLCYTEMLYASKNNTVIKSHRSHRFAIRQEWLTQNHKLEGSVLNHALLFERKGYDGEARAQLVEWAKQYPAYHKLLNIKPKWGLDFSMDYYDSEGNTFEVLHWEFDSFNYDEIIEKKEQNEERFTSIDWDDGAKSLLRQKDSWFNLDFFAQSEYKCNFFGIESERWKMVVWN